MEKNLKVKDSDFARMEKVDTPINKYVDKEKDNLGKNSMKLFTLANFLRANRRIIREYKDVESTKTFLIRYWDTLISNIVEFKLLQDKQLYKCDLREDYILTLSVTLQIFGRLGKCFYEDNLDLNLFKIFPELLIILFIHSLFVLDQSMFFNCFNKFRSRLSS